MITQSHSNFYIGSVQIYLDWIEPVLCIMSGSCNLIALSFAAATVLQLPNFRFSCSLNIPTNRMWTPHPGEQVGRVMSVMRLASGTNPPSCPPLWPSDLQMHPWNPLTSFHSVATPGPRVLSLLHGSSLSLLCLRCFLEPDLLAPPHVPT